MRLFIRNPLRRLREATMDHRFDIFKRLPNGSTLWITTVEGLADDVTGGFCTSGSEREFTLEGSWYANEEIQAGADCDAVAAG